MDATTRWETEAIRSGSSKRATPPRPTSKQGSTPHKDRTWLTLKEAEAATGIPSNTLRKWVRKDAIDTYLESDGEMAIRMVDLDSVLARAEELGREIEKSEIRSQKSESTETETSRPPFRGDGRDEVEPGGPASQRAPADTAEVGSQKSEVRSDSDALIGDRKSEIAVDEPPPESKPESASSDTMLVPVDAWNKMLNQLGNLHEAGQQLAEARERAAKAETEALFLKERLREMREDANLRYRSSEVGEDPRSQIPDPSPATDDRTTDAESGKRKAESGAEDQRSQIPDPSPATDDRTADAESGTETTTYWRYLTTGWRDRKRRS